MKLNDFSDWAKAIFILYLMVSGNYIGTLFGCKIQNLFDNNMIVKHILGFATLYFFITLIEDSKDSNKDKPVVPPQKKLLNTAFIYFAFLMSSKMTIQFWIPFLLMIGGIYILSIFKDYYITEEITEGTPGKMETIDKIQNYLLIGSIITLVVGFIYYIGEKKIEYGKDFSYYTFMIGNPTCRINNPKIKESFPEILAIAIKPEKYTA